MTDTDLALGYIENLPATDPKAIVAREIPVPALREHDLLVEVKAVSVNPVDVKERASAPSHGFRVLGFDAAGVVREVGPEVTLFQPGDAVFYAGDLRRPGTNQRLHAVDERIVGRKPAAVGFAEAASLPLTALTAYEAIFDRLGLPVDAEGDLLIVGATGGVGSIMIQLVKQLAPRVRVIATASGPDAVEWVTGLGADEVVDHHGDLRQQVGKLSPAGVDWLFTSHSAGQIELYADIVRAFGHVVAIDDGSRDVSPLKSKAIAWHWELMFAAPVHTPESTRQHQILEHIAALVDAGQVRPTLSRLIEPLDADGLRRAHEIVEDGHVMGKVVVVGW